MIMNNLYLGFQNEKEYFHNFIYDIDKKYLSDISSSIKGMD